MEAAYSPVLRSVQIPKRGGGTRTLTLLPRSLGSSFARAVARVAPAVDASLPRGVFADRLLGRSGRMEPWRSALGRARRTERAFAAGPGPRLSIDVHRCFDSIAPDVVERALRNVGCRREATAAVRAQLESFAEMGVEGIPTGPAASAILANAVLSALDGVFEARRVPYVRWVDDVIAFPASEADAICMLSHATDALAAVGLRPNVKKTGVRDPFTRGTLEASSGFSLPAAWRGVSSAR